MTKEKIKNVRDELLGIENNAKNIDGLTDGQWYAIRVAHKLLGELLEIKDGKSRKTTTT